MIFRSTYKLEDADAVMSISRRRANSPPISFSHFSVLKFDKITPRG
jgi:hypothetical protein